jgi:protein TonB
MRTHLHPAIHPPANPNIPGSLILHVGFIGLLMALAWMHHTFFTNWGSATAGAGTIQASLVSSIPLPSRQTVSDNVLATENPGNPTLTPPPGQESRPDEIEISGKPKPTAKLTAPKPPLRPQPFAPTNTIAPGESAGLRIPVSTLQLASGTATMSVTTGDFGARFAYYVAGINRTVSSQWWTQEADPHTSNGRSVTLVFDVLRDGTPTNVRIEKASGSSSLDVSARHALQRVDGFGPLPDAYRGDRISVEYTFDYRLP